MDEVLFKAADDSKSAGDQAMEKQAGSLQILMCRRMGAVAVSAGLAGGSRALYSLSLGAKKPLSIRTHMSHVSLRGWH